jgi:hypothetical protein
MTSFVRPCHECTSIYANGNMTPCVAPLNSWDPDLANYLFVRAPLEAGKPLCRGPPSRDSEQLRFLPNALPQTSTFTVLSQEQTLQGIARAC